MPWGFLLRLGLVAAVIGLIVLLITAPDPAKSAINTNTSCSLGQFCIYQHATNVGAVSGDDITFSVKLRNNLNFASRNLVLRYNVARQVIVRSSKPEGRFRQDVLVWRVPRLEPGDTWTVKVKVEVLAYAKKTVANTATVVYGGQTWLRSRLSYRINDPVVAVIIEEGAS